METLINAMLAAIAAKFVFPTFTKKVDTGGADLIDNVVEYTRPLRGEDKTDKQS